MTTTLTFTTAEPTCSRALSPSLSTLSGLMPSGVSTWRDSSEVIGTGVFGGTVFGGTVRGGLVARHAVTARTNTAVNNSISAAVAAPAGNAPAMDAYFAAKQAAPPRGIPR